MPGQPPQRLEDFDQIRRYIRSAVTRACPGWGPEDVEEVTHQAILRLMKLSQAEGRDGGFTKAYLCRAAYTHIVDEYRRRRGLVPLESHEETRGELSSRGTDPEEDCSMKELQDAIRECLQRLNPNRRRAVGLLLLGYGNREIAGRMGWGAKQAENHITRGRADLRSCLGAKGYGS